MTFGKYLGGGGSFGAFGGRRELMQHFDPGLPDAFEHAGTFNNNVLSMAAGLAGLSRVFTPAEALRLNALGDQLRDRINQVAVARAGRFCATGVGSLLGLHFGLAPPSASVDPEHDRRLMSIQALFHLELLERGYYFGRRGYVSLSLPMTVPDCDGFATAIDDFLAERGHLIDAALG